MTLAVARIARVPWWRRLRSRLMSWCRRCRHRDVKILSNDDGIGGRCESCGRLFGWVTREELRAYAQRLYPLKGEPRLLLPTSIPGPGVPTSH